MSDWFLENDVIFFHSMFASLLVRKLRMPWAKVAARLPGSLPFVGTFASALIYQEDKGLLTASVVCAGYGILVWDNQG